MRYLTTESQCCNAKDTAKVKCFVSELDFGDVDHAHFCLRNEHSYQSRPSYSPSPLIAMAPCTCHFLPFKLVNPKASQTSAVLSAPFYNHKNGL